MKTNIVTILNIGLRTNIGTDLVAADVVEYIVARISQHEYRDSVTSFAWRIEEAKYEHEGETRIERTLVLRVAQHAALSDNVIVNSPEVFLWSERLHQDCIAVFWYDKDTGGSHGELVGPKAAEWGAFDPKYFIRY